jgi:hypothetical protein
MGDGVADMGGGEVKVVSRSGPPEARVKRACALASAHAAQNLGLHDCTRPVPAHMNLKCRLLAFAVGEGMYILGLEDQGFASSKSCSIARLIIVSTQDQPAAIERAFRACAHWHGEFKQVLVDRRRLSVQGVSTNPARLAKGNTDTTQVMVCLETDGSVDSKDR